MTISDKTTSSDLGCHTGVTICDDSIGDSLCNKQGDTGHERLLDRALSTDVKGLAHCRASRPPNYFYFAVMVSICNCPFGGLAVIFSLLSKKAYNDGNFEDAKTRGTISKWLSITGIAVAIVATAFLIVYFVYIDNNIVDTVEELRGH